MNDPNMRLALSGEEPFRDSYADRVLARDDFDQARQDGQLDIARGALGMIVEAAEYISDRTMHLSANVTESIKATETLGAVARQVRTLSSNTSLEASRLGGHATVAEIARQMRLLSQQVTALSEHLTACQRAQGIAVGEMSGAIDAVVADAAATQAILARGVEDSGASELPATLTMLQSVPTLAPGSEVTADA